MMAASPNVSYVVSKLSNDQARKAPRGKASMAWVPVVSYYLRYNTADKQPVVGIYYQGENGQPEKILAQHFPVPAQDALFLADMLRNEGPVYFDPATGALASGKETVGEGEANPGSSHE
jgi:hypothetical protein